MNSDSGRDAELASSRRPTFIPYEPFPAFSDWLAEPFDSSTVDKFASQLSAIRAESDSAALEDAMRVATRWAAVNTGAIEGLYEVDRGFTYTVAMSAAAWDDIHRLKGTAAADSMQDALAAYDFVLDATTGSMPISEAWMRRLHEIVTASQTHYTVLTTEGPQEQILPRGRYKMQPNNPFNFASQTVHSYASPLETPAEMARLVDQLRSPEFATAHPVLQAAYAHYSFVCIHPFADGNGRVSRALASTYLYRNPGVPLVIFADQKGTYLDTLEAADDGDPRRFVQFVADRVIDTVGMVQSQLHAAAVPDVAAQLAALAPVLSGKEGLAHTEIDALASRLLDVFGAAMDKQVRENPLPRTMSSSVNRVRTSTAGLPPNYRAVPGVPGIVRLGVGSAAPATGDDVREYAVAVLRPNQDGADFVIYSPTRIVVEAYLRELHPEVGSALVFRAEAGALREFREAISSVAKLATDSLRKRGYVE